MCQQPNTAAEAQEQNAKIHRVKPGLQKCFHFCFLLVNLNFHDHTIRKGEAASPSWGDWVGDWRSDRYWI